MNKLYFQSAQFCRGIETDFGVEVKTKSPRTRTDSTSFDTNPILNRNSGSDQSKTPAWEDIIIASSAVPDYISHRYF
jgi:hypothetical protein